MIAGEIALVACRVVAAHGFDHASLVRIAREAAAAAQLGAERPGTASLSQRAAEA